MRKQTRVHVTLALSLAALALALVLARGGEEAAAAAFTVTKTTDSADGACNADCSLREAIQATNANGVASFDTISVPAGTFTLTLAGSDTGAPNAAIGDLDITYGLLTIDGAGAGATIINGNGIDRIFEVKFSTNLVTIKELTIQNGSSAGVGGGIAIGNSAVVTMDNVIVESNSSGQNGGGLYSVGTLTLDHSTVRNNFAAGFGGGVQNGTLGVGAISINNSVIHNNMAGGAFGGGLNNEYNAALANVTISDNVVAAGGGTGGGVRHLSGVASTMTMTNVTIAANSASSGGGFRRTTAGNDPVLKNVILALNTGGNCATTNGGIASAGHNLSSDGTCPFAAGGDQNNVNPNLSALQNNGGPTLTRALAAGSAATNTGDNNGCPPTDQRGVTRPSGGTCDIGAYEFDSGPPPTPAPTPTPTAVPTPTPVPTPSPVPTPTAVPGAFGNVDCMGGINSVDSLKVLRANAGLGYIQTEPCENIGTEMTPWNWLQGDVDCSGAVNSVDSLKVLRHNAGLSVSQSEPCPNIAS